MTERSSDSSSTSISTSIISIIFFKEQLIYFILKTLCADDIFYIEIPKDSLKKLLDLINKFSIVAGYKINIQKAVTFSHTNHKLSEKYTKKTIPFTTASKTMKYLGIILTEKVKDRYPENYKAMMKPIDGDTNKWKDITCSWIARINIAKISILPKSIYRFNAIIINIPMAFFYRNRKKQF